jgi:hypothetical protein
MIILKLISKESYVIFTVHFYCMKSYSDKRTIYLFIIKYTFVAIRLYTTKMYGDNNIKFVVTRQAKDVY